MSYIKFRSEPDEKEAFKNAIKIRDPHFIDKKSDGISDVLKMMMRVYIREIEILKERFKLLLINSCSIVVNIHDDERFDFNDNDQLECIVNELAIYYYQTNEERTEKGYPEMIPNDYFAINFKDHYRIIG